MLFSLARFEVGSNISMWKRKYAYLNVSEYVETLYFWTVIFLL